ncbi:ABC transporter permease [Dokdonia sp. Hel_I_53]|uniref:ABC transporter permease n=1 Tax=Dokdonia sp. Hel_I_53 TaxID=1566287 RepID=UPI00119C8B6B|nr:FtsX-like permease family protein [Dokdonia sp. Hel_I_53]TVZ53042.1 lipoprotein-releasing system permease protein [Dokdonia sp. Hel_I_53]
MRFPLFIAKRYLISKSGTNAVNIITLISVISIIIGTMVLFIVLSAFSGLKEFNLSITSVIDPDLKIIPASGKTITFTKEQENDLRSLEEVHAFSKIIEERAYLEYEGKTALAFIKGVDEHYLDVTSIDSTVFYGTWPSVGEPEVAMGFLVRKKLSLNVGDYGSLLKIMTPKPGTGQLTDPSQAFNTSKAIASGVFQAGEALDNDHIFANIDFVGALLEYPLDKISSLEIKMREGIDEELLRIRLERIFSDQVIIKNRIQLNDALYKMLNTENLALYFICTLVLIIALFSFVGSLIMIIIDKRKHIKTLSDLGASLPTIRKTFFTQGTLMIIIGGFIGIFLGSALILLQQEFGFIPITATLPYPVKFELINLMIVLTTILVLGLLAARLAATRINKKLIAIP